MPMPQSLGDTPQKAVKITLGTFAEFLSASPSQRLDCVQRQRASYAQPFTPGASFYQEFVVAAQRGRQTGNDVMNLRAAVAKQRVPARQSHYSELTDAWLEWIETQGWPSSEPVGRSDWQLPALVVGITPEFALRQQDGTVTVLKLWLKRQPLTKDGATAALRLLDQHMGRLSPGGSAAVLDVRRRTLHEPSRRKPRKNYDAWLESEAVAFAHLWQTIDRQSA